MLRTLKAAGIALAVALPLGTVSAQTIERPVAFDSAQRVAAITAPLAERLHLTGPTWPVRGEFREARLYTVEPTGGFVLVVQRPDGVIERFPLSEADRAALRASVDVAMRLAGNPTGESGSDIMSEPAGNAFARRQTILALIAYGPLAASLATDGQVAGALYLAVTGGTFFATYGGAQSSGITRAQNELGGDLGLAGGAAGWLAGYAATGNSDRGTRALALGGALAGTIAGINLGRGLTDAEAHSASAGVRSTALLTLATAEAAGASKRGIAMAVAASEIVGFPIGLAYARRSSYTVSAGDVEATGTVGLIGAAYGAAIVGELPHPSHREYGIGVGSAYLAGLVIGDQLISRQLDLTQSQSSAATLGAFAGALIGAAVPTLFETDDNLARFGATALGATLGMMAVIGVSNPKPESGRRARAELHFDGFGALAALQGMPGRHPILRVTF